MEANVSVPGAWLAWTVIAELSGFAGCEAAGDGVFAGGDADDDWATAPIAAVRIKTVGVITRILPIRKEKDLKLLTPG